MAHFTMISMAMMAMALLVPITLTQSSDGVLPCLVRTQTVLHSQCKQQLTRYQTQCLQQTTQPCTTSSLPLLINCVNTQCLSENNGTSSTEISTSSMALTYAPKMQYSCQQSILSGSLDDTTSMQLTGDGKCMTSPYDFQSMFVSTSPASDDDEGVTLQKMAGQCSLMLYSNEGCKDDETKLDLSGVQGDKCIFKGGRSARLACTALRAPDTRE